MTSLGKLSTVSSVQCSAHLYSAVIQMTSWGIPWPALLVDVWNCSSETCQLNQQKPKRLRFLDINTEIEGHLQNYYFLRVESFRRPVFKLPRALHWIKSTASQETKRFENTSWTQAVCARRSAKNYGCNFHCKKAKWRQNGGEMSSVFFLNYRHYFYFKSY